MEHDKEAMTPKKERGHALASLLNGSLPPAAPERIPEPELAFWIAAVERVALAQARLAEANEALRALLPLVTLRLASPLGEADQISGAGFVLRAPVGGDDGG